uniref:Uncharacterized protein n=2 Tax=Cyprinus carpio TaxID=7962 RepID=A0A8C1ERP5_CYPCA
VCCCCLCLFFLTDGSNNVSLPFLPSCAACQMKRDINIRKSNGTLKP